MAQEGLRAGVPRGWRSLGLRPRGGKGSRRGNCSRVGLGGMRTGPSREGPFLKGPYQVDTGGRRGGSADRGRRWSTPVAWEAGDQALFPVSSRCGETEGLKMFLGAEEPEVPQDVNKLSSRASCFHSRTFQDAKSTFVA